MNAAFWLELALRALFYLAPVYAAFQIGREFPRNPKRRRTPVDVVWFIVPTEARPDETHLAALKHRQATTWSVN